MVKEKAAVVWCKERWYDSRTYTCR